MKIVCFLLSNEANSDTVWDTLSAAGYSLLFQEESQEKKEIVGYLPNQIDILDVLRNFPEIIDVKPTDLPDINWNEQWALQPHQDAVSIDLHDWNPACHTVLQMKPGPGFGDLTHPTTKLVLQMMVPYVKEKVVLDIGCGSGILSVAASCFGAKFVYGIDIDPQAIQHAKENGLLNGLHNAIAFCLPEEFYPNLFPDLYLMNMIYSEQKVAWASLSHVNNHPAICITSGVLKEQENEYLKLTNSWGWKLLSQSELDGWLGFTFKL